MYAFGPAREFTVGQHKNSIRRGVFPIFTDAFSRLAQRTGSQRRSYLFAGLVLLLALAVAGCQAVGGFTGSAVATVNGEDIPRDEWTNLLEGQYGQQVLEELINMRLIEQAAADAGIEVTEEDMDEALNLYVLPQFGGDYEALEAQLEMMGLTRSDLDEDLRFFVLQNRLMIEKAEISEDAARQRFESDPLAYLPHDMDPEETTEDDITFEMVEDQVYLDMAHEQFQGGQLLLHQLRQEADIQIHIN